ncbi:hypothetical protein CH35J_010230 [Colletotrichum higginsianum]|nr:hypothetical protein CH35J_010230 [Colletotrichum higginsianum]
MHGWYTDTTNNQYKMAPKPGLNLEYAPSRGNGSVSGIPVADAIPNYGVTDGSKIDVVIVESDMRNSLVRNNFEKSSMDSKIAMGYSGLGVAIGTGTSSDAQNSQSSERNRSTKRMIGKYMLPRVTLFLNADDLVPTREFAENIEHIRKTKDVAEIRKFHRKFGQFFCHEVTLGGMLVSTKTLTDDEMVEQDKNRDMFKHAIGLTVSSPVEVGGDSKSETSRGSDQDLSRSYKASSNDVVFEAVGGNTILASNPGQWCPTVGNHVNWRVIERADSRLIIDSLIDIGDPRFTSAADAFSGATPGPATKGISIPKLNKILAQLRFKTKITSEKTHYLYHDIHNPIVAQTKSERKVSPPRFQGPRAAPYVSSWESKDGIWVITPTFDTRLVDGSTVTISSARSPQSPWFLSVLRTNAGLFMPCMTTSEQFVWRVREVLRPSSSSKTTVGERPSLQPLKHDAWLCLTFDYDDNPRGFRDFKDDDRGSRNVEFPESESRQLVLVEAPNKSDSWEDRGVLLLSNGDDLKPDSSPRVMTLDDVEISVKIAQFRIDVRDGMDDDYDILEMIGGEIEAQYEAQQKKMKSKGHGVSD